jgi:hypothetical protein
LQRVRSLGALQFEGLPKAVSQVLATLLQNNREAITERWLELTLATYRSDSAGFLLAQKNRFANPVGQTLVQETAAIVDGLLRDAAPDDICGHLEEVIKIRAVQEFSPSQAVSFVFLLKDAIREEIADPLVAAKAREGLLEIEDRIDQMALFAFDIYVKWREQVYNLRLQEIRKGYVQTK